MLSRIVSQRISIVHSSISEPASSPPCDAELSSCGVYSSTEFPFSAVSLPEASACPSPDCVECSTAAPVSDSDSCSVSSAFLAASNVIFSAFRLASSAACFSAARSSSTFCSSETEKHSSFLLSHFCACTIANSFIASALSFCTEADTLPSSPSLTCSRSPDATVSAVPSEAVTSSSPI